MKKLKKKQMQKIFSKTMIYLDLFGIGVYYTKDKDEFEKMCRWIKAEAVTNVGGRAMLNVNDDGSIMIYLGWFNDDIGTLVHECVHAASYVAEAIGHKMHSEDEIVPYVAGYLARQCLDRNPVI